MKILFQGLLLLFASTLCAQLPNPPAALEYLKTVELEFQQAQEQLALQARGETQLIDQVRHDTWGLNDCDFWVTDRHTYYTYDNLGRVAETVSFIENGSIWVENTRTTNTYSGGLLIRTVEDNWAGDQWLPASQILYSYENDCLLGYVNEVYVGSEWIGFIKTEFIFDEEDNLVETLISLGNPNGWEFWLRMKHLFINELGQAEETLTEQYDAEFGFWEPWLSKTTQFDAAGNPSYSLVLDWDGLDWKNSQEVNYAYDVENRQTLRLVKSWSELSGGFVPFKQYISEYYPQENLDRFITLDAVTGGTGWAYIEQDVYIYQVINNLEEIAAKEAIGTLAPNPASDFMQLSLDSESSDAGHLLIYDNQGRLVFQQAAQWSAGQTQLGVPVRALTPGSYYLLLQGQEGRILTQAFQIQ